MSLLHLGQDDQGAPLAIPPAALRTHGVVVGMTGSGKTGLSIVLLEELVQAGVPIIAVDPKGDLGNLALLFPAIRAEDLAPWLEPGQDAEATARSWREGLRGAGIGPERVEALRERMDLRILTPGSEAGTPVDVVSAFRRPAEAALQDPEALTELVGGAVSGLLGLVGEGGDPLRDPAHIVLSHVLEAAWLAGEDPDLETLILRLLDPPFEKVGVFPLDRFFPPEKRTALGMKLNGVVASRGFLAWSRGAPLSIEAMLGGPAGAPEGRVPVTVLHLAHLPDGQRIFFLSLLLSRLRAWSRAMPGTQGLRALLFFDEVAGYLPPHPANPPTKEPLLGMMKQARAVGLGVLLATQNPVDVDYKALSNAGLWMIGRLQTAQDRDRLLKGLSRPDLDEAVAGLGKRRFLLVDAGSDQPRIFGVRQAMSFLRGPLTRAELQRLREPPPGPPLPGRPPPVPPLPAASPPSSGGPPPVPPLPAASPPPPGGPPPVPPPVPPTAPLDREALLAAPPPAPGETWFLDPAVAFAARFHGLFLSRAGPGRPDGRTVFRPALVAELELRFDEERLGFQLDERLARVWYPLDTALGAPLVLPLEPGDLLAQPPAGALFAPLPAWLDEPRELAALQRQVLDEVARSETRGMFVHPGLKLYGRGGERREAFEARVKAAAEAAVQVEETRLAERLARESRRMEDRIRAAEAKVVEQKGLVKDRQLQEAVNVGQTLLSLFSGRSRSLNTAMSKRSQTSQAQTRLEQSEQLLRDLVQEAYELERRAEEERQALRGQAATLALGIEERPVPLERNDIRVLRFGILWVPASRRLPG